jgi:hypothetical protein
MQRKVGNVPAVASVLAAFAMFAPTGSEATPGPDVQISRAQSKVTISSGAVEAIESKAQKTETMVAFGEHWAQSPRERGQRKVYRR